ASSAAAAGEGNRQGGEKCPYDRGPSDPPSMMRGFRNVAYDSITSRANQRIDFPGLDDTLLLGGLDGESLLFPANLLVFGWGEHRSRDLDVAGRSVSSWWGSSNEAVATASRRTGTDSPGPSQRRSIGERRSRSAVEQ